jgi:uncharacterized protein (DUF885 family)
MRTPTAMDALADKHFDAEVALSPIMMTFLGMDDHQDEFDDFSPQGIETHHRLIATTLGELDSTVVSDETDRITASALRERLGLAMEAHQSHEDLASISNIVSGLHSIREVFDLMPTGTDSDFATIARRLKAVPHAVDGWIESQFAAIDEGIKPAVRQVDALVEQVHGWIKDGGTFDTLTDQAHEAGASTTTRDLLTEGLTTAKAAYREATQTLVTRIHPMAVEEDAVGPHRYDLASREFLGTTVEMEQTYQWGLEQVAELEERQREICATLRPGMTIAETKNSLDEDPAYLLHGSTAMQEWMQMKADQAIQDLHGTHFDVPEPARRIECMIAPTHDGGIYYTDPSDDFSRPGRMWWSVPEGQTTFSTWRELTTVYHEGVPGHHLQLSQAIFNKAELNKWRRSGIWVSGHGEGWALYSEQLMADLGYLDDPAMMLGMLDGQALRAVRVVIDIGLHCGFTPPAEVGESTWTFDNALAYFNSHVAMDPSVARFEVMRYFGWAGQAPSYKIGQKAWTDLRDEVHVQQGSTFDLKSFHAKALNLGALGLDTLKEALLT